MSARSVLACLISGVCCFAGATDLNPLTGELELQQADLEVGEGDASYTLLRTYAPSASVTGWHWSCDTRLVFAGETPTWIDEGGQGTRFAADAEGWVATHGSPLRLRALTRGFELTTPERHYRFDLAGRLIARTTRGTTLSLRHGPQGAVAVAGPWGELLLTRGPGGVEQANLESRVVRYAYRGGRLAGVARGPLRQRFAYDAAGRLTQVDDTAIRYDEEGRLIELSGGRIPLRASYTVSETDWTCTVTEGVRQRSYRHTTGRRSTLAVSEAGSTRTLQFDARNRPVSSERNGTLERSWRYDRHGRLVELHSPAGDLRMRYDAASRPTQTTLPSGETLRFVYDGDGRLLASTSRAGTERYAYDPQGQLVRHRDARGMRTDYARDSHGYLVEIRTPGQRTRIERSTAGDVLSVTHPDGRVSRYSESGAAVKVSDGEGTLQASAYDAQGRMIAYQDPFGRATRVTYNELGLIARCFDADGERFGCDYDGSGQLTAVRDAAGNTVSYTRPDAHTLIVRDPSAGERTLRFDAEGRVIHETRGEATLTFRYDAAGRMVGRTTPRGSERFTYDAAGNLLSQSGPDGELRYTYDAQGRLSSAENRVALQTIRYRYRGAERQPSEVSYPWGSVRYSYDAAGKLLDVVAGDTRVEITRRPDGRRATVRYSNGVETRYSYQGSKLSEVSSTRGGSLISRRAYTYTSRGRLESVTDERDLRTVFSHDRRGRLLSAVSPQRAERYSYDAAGNRTAVDVDGAAQDVELIAGNRISKQGATAYTYGSHGALTAKQGESGTWSYDLDVDGRQRAARGPDGASVRYGYAPDGTPLWRDVAGERTALLVDRQQVVGEFQAGQLTRSYVRGEALDDTLLTEAGESSWTFHRDLVGSVTALTDAEGEVVARYRYGAFGETLSAQGPAADANRWRFAGRPLDAVTGLYDVRARAYDPQLGRFTSPDPSGREGGLNLYAYAENDPTRLTDPLGLAAELGSRSQRAATPRKGFFSRMLDAIDEVGQNLPGPGSFVYNLVKGVGQAAVDTVVGVGELFKKETWVALGDFVSELDDWETVKAVGKHLLDAGIDIGERYIDAALNDPDEFARMTGYGAGMVAGSVLGSKGIDKLAQVARAAKAARAARRAAAAADDVVDARRRLSPVVLAGANAADEGLEAASDAARAGGAGQPKKGVVQALDEDAPLGQSTPTDYGQELADGLEEGLSAPLSAEARAAIAQRTRELTARAEAQSARGSLRSEVIDQERMARSGTVRGGHGAKPGTNGAQIASANFRRADELVQEWVRTGEPLSLDRIKQLNATLGEGLQHNGLPPGQLRGPGMDVNAGGSPVKSYLLGDRVEGAMQDFMTWYETASAAGVEPIELAARAYQRLVSIHPFADGNGRTSRMVMDYILQRSGLPPAAMVDTSVAVFGAERVLNLPGLGTTPEQAIAKVLDGVERSLDLLSGGGR